MVHWPPQPCVEDEVTSLEHEQIPPSMVEALKSDDDPAISRGAVDQTPIIDDNKIPVRTQRQVSTFGTKLNPELADINSSDDSTGPVTPPSLYRHDSTRQSSKSQHKGGPPSEPSLDQKAASFVKQQGRGRPEVSRIDTGLGADLEPMVTGTRRAPSPYAYSRNSGTYTPSLPQAAQTLSPINGRTSPVQDRPTQNLRFSPSSPNEARAVMSDEPDTTGRERRRYRSKSRARSRSHPREPSSRRNRSSRRRQSDSSSERDSKTSHRYRKEDRTTAPSASSQRYHSDRETFTPPRSRRQSKESYYGTGGEDYSYRGMRYSKSAQQSYESPYTSSNDDAGYKSRPRDRGLPETSQRRSSTNRRERIQVDNLAEDTWSRKVGKANVDDSAMVSTGRNRYSNLETTTPLTADATGSMEDYFERAFRDNDSRRAKVDRSYHSSGSALASPSASPPRTSKAERQSREYLEVDEITRPSQKSRPPSVGEGQLSTLKSYTSLLSAATAGAALAARGSTDQPSAGRMTTSQRSSRPSPVLEDRITEQYPGTTIRVDSPRAMQDPSLVPARPPNPRLGASSAELPHPQLPQRAASYSGYDQPKGILRNPTGSKIDADYGRESSSYGSGYTPRAAHTASSVVDRDTVLKFPECPRPKPVSGYKDWYSIKEMSDLDICPTCLNALRATRFTHLFVPSLPRPYNEPSVCVMSKPWPRIAVMRAHLQRRSDLSYLKSLTTLPKDTRACSGKRTDARNWFFIVDPATKEPIPNFAACAACARSIEVIFPELHGLLQRDPNAPHQEKVCSVNAESKHFPNFIDQFEQAAMRCEGRVMRSTDIQPLVTTLRKACRFPECSRDKLLSTRIWHFMPDLPEFTICEECFHEVVWPVSDRAIARDVSKTLKLVPARRNSMGSAGMSCQLYSDRMRKVFRDALATRNLAPLREAVKNRQATQLRLQEMNKLYEADQKYGIDRRSEISRNNAIWRSLE